MHAYRFGRDLLHPSVHICTGFLAVTDVLSVLAVNVLKPCGKLCLMVMCVMTSALATSFCDVHQYFVCQRLVIRAVPDILSVFTSVQIVCLCLAK